MPMHVEERTPPVSFRHFGGRTLSRFAGSPALPLELIEWTTRENGNGWWLWPFWPSP